MHIVIISPGRAGESFIQEGIMHYFKKIKPYHPITLEHFFSTKNSGSEGQLKQWEAQEIIKRLQPTDYVLLLDERGAMESNKQWAAMWQQALNGRAKRIVFIIGGAYGVSDEVKSRANAILSLSKLVLPHQLVRLVVAEQIYRTLAILHHLPYHHQ